MPYFSIRIQPFNSKSHEKLEITIFGGYFNSISEAQERGSKHCEELTGYSKNCRYHKVLKVQQVAININSPWGEIQDSVEYAPGVVCVETDRHGGCMIDSVVAYKILPQSLIDMALIFDDFVCLEEDLMVDIATVVSPEFAKIIYNRKSAENKQKTSLQEFIEDNLTGLSERYPEMLEEAGYRAQENGNSDINKVIHVDFKNKKQ